MRRSDGSTLILSILLLVAVLAVYWPAQGYGPTDLDDYDYLVDNPHVSRGLTLRSIGWAITSFRAANWHPLTWLSHLTDVSLYGRQYGKHHLVSVILHALNAALVLLVLREFTGALWPSALAAALFALHPLRVESVAWLSERKDILAGLCFLLVLLAYLKYVRRPSPARYLAVAVLYTLGLMAKQMLVTLPFLLLLLDWWPLGRFGGHGGAEGRPETGMAWLPGLVGEKLPLLILSMAAGWLTLLAQRSGGALRLMEEYPAGLRGANAVVAYGRYLLKTVRPVGLAVFYPHPRVSYPAWRVAVAAALLAVITAVTLRGARRRPFLAAGWFWFLGMLLPVIGLVQVGDAALADRYTYLPHLGLFIAGSWGMCGLVAAYPRARIAIAATAAAALILLAAATRHQLGYWRDDATLFGHAVSVTRDNWMMQYNLGNVRARRGDRLGAADLYRKALLIRPRYPEALNNHGAMLVLEGRDDEAERAFVDALKFWPSYAGAWYNLGVLRQRQGREDEALAALESALRHDPEFRSAWVLKAEVLQRLNRIGEARDARERSASLNPD